MVDLLILESMVQMAEALIFSCDGLLKSSWLGLPLTRVLVHMQRTLFKVLDCRTPIQEVPDMHSSFYYHPFLVAISSVRGVSEHATLSYKEPFLVLHKHMLVLRPRTSCLTVHFCLSPQPGCSPISLSSFI